MWRKYWGLALLVLACLVAPAVGQPVAATGPADDAIRRLTDEVHNLGWIVFSARSDKGDWDLYECRPDGSGLRNITQTPDYNEVAAKFSRDGKRLLYRRLAKAEAVNGNRYGAQGELVLADSDGRHPEVFGKSGEYPWACWSPDCKQLACLSVNGITIVDIASKRQVRQLDRSGFFQQLSWSPDGKWLGGVCNGFGAAWSIARMDLATGKANAVSTVDCCTPDWFPDSQRLVFSNRISGQKTNNGYGWTQLWMADGAGKERTLVYAEDDRHVYGGQISPDGKHVLFTGNLQEDGDPAHAGATMNLMRLADAPMVCGNSPAVKAKYPGAKSGPLLTLPRGWEPYWTGADISPDPAAPKAAADPSSQLAAEVKDKGWIAFSAQTDKGNWELFMIRPDGSDRHALTDTPQFNSVGIKFSPDGQKVLYYRMPKNESADNNTYGKAEHELVVADSNGGNPVVYGAGFGWASWGKGLGQIACLDEKGIRIVDLASRKAVQTLARKRIFQQLVWSPDGQSFVGTANGLGTYWTIGRLNATTEQINAVSETDRYNCTPNWFPDSQRIVFSRGIIPDHEGFAELFSVTPEGKDRKLIYAEKDRHIYGGRISPDGKYALFTRSEKDLGEVAKSGTTMALIRLADAPMLGGADAALAQKYPDAKAGTRLDLGSGWEPQWTHADIKWNK